MFPLPKGRAACVTAKSIASTGCCDKESVVGAFFLTKILGASSCLCILVVFVRSANHEDGRQDLAGHITALQSRRMELTITTRSFQAAIHSWHHRSNTL
jgi:hypothetical protein